jgi:hypothetical protein
VGVSSGCGSAANGSAARFDGPRPVPTPIGRGAAFVPPVRGAGPPPRLPCSSGPLEGRERVHLELFARGRVVVVPRGIGVARGCRYPVRTLAPTGVVDFGRAGLRLGDVFAVWRMPLSRTRLLDFRGPVRAYVAGRRRAGDPRAIPLRDGEQLVLEVGPYVPPHSFYLFPPRRAEVR